MDIKTETDSVTRTHYCSICNNKYSTLNDCPECKIPLSEMSNEGIQLINSNNNQVIQKAKNSIIIKENNVHEHCKKEDLAEYDTKHIRTFPSFWHVIKGRAYFGISLSGVGLFTWLSGTASILSWVGISENTISITELLTYMLLIVIGIKLLEQIANFSSIASLDYQSYYRYKDIVYTRNDDDSIESRYIYAKCPVKGCTGHLYLGVPVDNIEGVGYAGLCNNKGYLHAFEFNDYSLVGNRIRITPKPHDENK